MQDGLNNRRLAIGWCFQKCVSLLRFWFTILVVDIAATSLGAFEKWSEKMKQL